jgi:hypothetical protein
LGHEPLIEIAGPATRFGVAVPVPPEATGIVEAATDRDGVVFGLETEGTNQEGHDADGDAKLVTVPPPPLPPASMLTVTGAENVLGGIPPLIVTS